MAEWGATLGHPLEPWAVVGQVKGERQGLEKRAFRNLGNFKSPWIKRLVQYPQGVLCREPVFGKAAHGVPHHWTMAILRTLPPATRGPLSVLLTPGVAKGTR